MICFYLDSGYPHDGRADKDIYRHDGRAYSLSLLSQSWQTRLVRIDSDGGFMNNF